MISMFVAGVVFIGAGLLGNLSATKILAISTALLISTLLISTQVHAATELSVQIEEPENAIGRHDVDLTRFPIFPTVPLCYGHNTQLEKNQIKY